MELFHLIDDGAAILRIRGRVYRQAKIYRRGEQIFAACAGGFVRLLRGSGTTHPDVTVIEVGGPGVEIRSGVPTFVEAQAKVA